MAEAGRRYPPYQTCHRRFQVWQRSGRLDHLLQRLAEDLRDLGQIDLSEAFVDATFASAKKGRWRRRDRDDRRESTGPRPHARWPPAAPYQPTMENRTLLRVAPRLPAR